MANVTTIGAYTISTTQNGMTFKRTGKFTNTGIQPVVLQGTGTLISRRRSRVRVPSGPLEFLVKPATRAGFFVFGLLFGL
jgi:hypothetical protein